MSQNRALVRSKSQLAIALSRLSGFKVRKVRQEQYEMDSEIGASCLWNAYLLGDIGQKVTFDLGCGTGILGIGALLLGAKKVVLIDSDEKALEIAKENLEIAFSFMESESSKEEDGEVNVQLGDLGKARRAGPKISKTIGNTEVELRHMDIRDLEGQQADVVIQNPPFGTKVRNADRVFLEKALEIAPITYSFHKSETKAFLEAYLAKKNAQITHIWDYKYPIKASYSFHRRQIHRINVSCFRILRE